MDPQICEGLTKIINFSTENPYANPINEQIARELQKRILKGEIPVDSRIPPTKAFAKIHGVSLVTMQKCLTILSKQGYLKRTPYRGSFTTLPKQKSAIGVIFGCDPFGVNSTFYRYLLGSLRDYALDLKLTLDFHYSLQGESFQVGLERIKQGIANKRYRCLIVFSTSVEMYRWCKTQESICILVPLINETVKKGNHITPEWSVQTGVSYLLDRGFKRITVISRVGKNTKVTSFLEAEAKAIEKAYSNHNAKMPSDTIQDWGLEALTGYQNARKFFTQPKSKWPEAIYSNHDLVTPGILAALSELGIQVPGDVALMTHSNKGVTFLCSTPLTKMEADPAELAKTIMTHIPRPTDRPELKTREIEVSLPFEFIPGKSCGE
jgi:DNA-binding LacI/PurR family transcriptional regulator